MARRKNKIPPEQGQLPIESSMRERYDPGDGNTNGSRGRRKSSVPEEAKQLSLLNPEVASQIIRDIGSKKWKPDGEKKNEKPVSISVDSTDDQNPFIDQFCEQLARIITKGKSRARQK